MNSVRSRTLAERLNTASASDRARVVWVDCPGCKGMVGVSGDCLNLPIVCPGCGLKMQASRGVLYVPPSTASLPTATKPTVDPISNPLKADSKPSHEVLRVSDIVFFWGLGSIVLGWTILVPFIGFSQFIEVTKACNKEKVQVPWKATVGLALCLLFGVTQGMVTARFMMK